MLKLDEDGMLIDRKIIYKRFVRIEHGNIDKVEAIIVHQTDSSSEEATFNTYVAGGNGAHFLIAKDGKIYQTASLKKRCYHVGRLIKSRCLEVNKNNCEDKDIANAAILGWTKKINAIDSIERQKKYPERFPVNSDSIGIELVGRHIDDKRYEAVTIAQNASLKWLVGELYSLFKITDEDTFRHPDVSKNLFEIFSYMCKPIKKRSARRGERGLVIPNKRPTTKQIAF